MSYKIKCTKSKDQQTVTIRQTDLTDISTITSISAKVYTSDIATPINTYSFTAQNLTDLKAGSVSIDSTTLLGITDDDWYKIVLDGDVMDSESAGVSITLEAAGKVYSYQGKIDVYSPNYRVDKVLHNVHMLYQEMNGIEDLDPSDQKRVDFTTRLATLKKILNYE